MRKQSSLNVLLFFLSIAGAAAAFLFGEILLRYISFLPYWIQCGLYLLFVMAVCCVVMILSEKIKTGDYLLKHRTEFGMTAGKAALIFLPAALLLGIVTQLLYSWSGFSISRGADFQGTMIVCDISDSMNDNDPHKDTVEAMVSYIDTIPLDEYLGIVVFNDQVDVLRRYSPLKDEREREDLKQMLRDEIYYSGTTDMDAALQTAIREMRASVTKDNWPGLVLLFSDGLPSYPIDYRALNRASEGDSRNARNRIPINTIGYYADLWLLTADDSELRRIADETGGEYIRISVGGDAAALRDAFSRSRSEFKWGDNEQHLIKYNKISDTTLKVILRALFLTLWGVLSGLFIVLFLNNSNLLKHFLIPKIIIAVVCGVAFTAIMQMQTAYNDAIGAIARAVLALDVCVMYLPTYRWD